MLVFFAVVATLSGQTAAAPVAFRKPEQLCGALQAQRMPVQREWQYGSGQIWFCESVPLEVGEPNKDGLVNDVQLFVHSDQKEVAKSVLLTASMMKSVDRKATVKRLSQLAASLFSTLVVEPPKNLEAAVLKGKPTRWAMPYGEVHLEATKGEIASSLTVHIVVAGGMPGDEP